MTIQSEGSSQDRWEQLRSTISLFLGLLLFAALLVVPMPALSLAAHPLAVVLALVIVFWVGEAIPIPLTALLGVALCVVLGIAPAKVAFAPFADPIVFLFIGSFILAEGLRETGLDRRIAVIILSKNWVSRQPIRVFFVLGLVTAFISMWVSNTATTAAMYPIALGILRAVQKNDMRNTPSGAATATLLLVAYSASIGGIGTPVGSPPNLIAIGMISRYLHFSISFFQWMLFAVPIVGVMYFVILVLLRLLEGDLASRISGFREWVTEHRALSPRLSRGETICTLAFATAIALWIFPAFIALAAGTDSLAFNTYNALLPEGVVAIIASSLLFLLPIDWQRRQSVLTWKQAAQIDWGTILMFGGGLSLGSLMFSTGLAEAIGKTVLQITGAGSLWNITAVAIALGILVSETTSNTASASMVIPIAISLASAAQVSGIPPALGACLGSSFGFMLPVSTPPNAIVYGSRLVPLTRMVRAGALLDLSGFFVIWLALRLACPLLGWA